MNDKIPVAKDPRLDGYVTKSNDERGRRAHEQIVKAGMRDLERITGRKPTEDQVRKFVQGHTERAERKISEQGK